MPCHAILTKWHTVINVMVDRIRERDNEFRVSFLFLNCIFVLVVGLSQLVLYGFYWFFWCFGMLIFLFLFL